MTELAGRRCVDIRHDLMNEMRYFWTGALVTWKSGAFELICLLLSKMYLLDVLISRQLRHLLASSVNVSFVGYS